MDNYDVKKALFATLSYGLDREDLLFLYDYIRRRGKQEIIKCPFQLLENRPYLEFLWGVLVYMFGDYGLTNPQHGWLETWGEPLHFLNDMIKFLEWEDAWLTF